MMWSSPESVVFFAIALACSFLAQSSVCAETGSRMDLIIRSEQEVYGVGDSISMELCLKNAGNGPINLFHPGPVNTVGPGWGLSLACHVTGPDGGKFVLEPKWFLVAHIQYPEARDFKLLSPGDAITIPIIFAAKGRWGKNTGNRWYAGMDLPEEYWGRPLEEVTANLGIEGEYWTPISLGGTTDVKRLMLMDVIQDVFRVEGEYELEFRYQNDTNYFLIPDEEGKYFVDSYVEDCWTGSLADTIVLTVVGTKDEPGVHQDDCRDAVD